MVILPTIFLLACDAPRQRRIVPLVSGEDSSYRDNGSTVTVSPTPTPTSTIPNNLKNCGFAASSSESSKFVQSAHLGGYKVCRPDSSSDTIYIQFQYPVSSNNGNKNICLFPTTSSTSGTVYIGEARCINVSAAYDIYPITMLRNRTNYSSYSMSGLMIMLDAPYYYTRFYSYVQSPDAYLFCMQWIDQSCSLGRCDSSYCDSFKSGAHYVYTSI